VLQYLWRLHGRRTDRKLADKRGYQTRRDSEKQRSRLNVEGLYIQLDILLWTGIIRRENNYEIGTLPALDCVSFDA